MSCVNRDFRWTLQGSSVLLGRAGFVIKMALWNIVLTLLHFILVSTLCNANQGLWVCCLYSVYIQWSYFYVGLHTSDSTENKVFNSGHRQQHLKPVFLPPTHFFFLYFTFSRHICFLFKQTHCNICLWSAMSKEKLKRLIICITEIVYTSTCD